MLDLEELKELFDTAYVHGEIPREKGNEDLIFYWITHWNDDLISASDLSYRGQFDVLRKAGRQIIGDLRGNPVQVDFKPIEEDRDDDADLLDGLYRTSTRENTSIEAFDNASTETVVCGVGAWELYTEYKTTRAGDRNQVIKRRPLYEANNQVFWDPSAKLIDKSDAQWCAVLVAYSEEGYEELSEELTGEEDHSPQSFEYPEKSYKFFWISDDKKIYVVNFYYREKVTGKVVILRDPFGTELTVSGEDFNKTMDSLIDQGYELVSEKETEQFEVTKYIASGKEILETSVIPGGEIPIIPIYGERAFVEGVEYWEGVTRLAKDPQMLRDFQLSYLSDLVSKSPRNKPIMTADQIAGYEFMYEDNGADNSYPYYLQNRLAKDGTPLPLGIAGEMPEQRMPTALIASIELSRQAVEDVANPGIPQDIADPDTSGKAVYALQNRLDQQSIVYQQNMKMAKRRDGMVYAAMASVVYDAPRKVMVTLPDGTTAYKQMMDYAIDADTGKPVMLNDLTNAEFDVWADIGLDYSSRKEQTLDRLDTMMANIAPGDPMLNILRLKSLQLMDGVNFDDIREYSNRQLIALGIKEPETDEERAILEQQQQQGEEPGADMVLAQAEMLKGQAAQLREKREMMKAQADIQNNQVGTEIDAFEAETDRMNTQVNAQKAGADINDKEITAFGKQLDNAAKIAQMQIQRANSDLRGYINS